MGTNYCTAKNFFQFHYLLSLVKFYPQIFSSGVKDGIVDIVTFTALAKILFSKITQYKDSWAW